VNNVSVRCLEVVERLQNTLDLYVPTIQVGRLADLPPLDDVLRNGLE
jgi:hypothetical protein